MQVNFTQFLIEEGTLAPEEISKLDPILKALYLNRMLIVDHNTSSQITRQKTSNMKLNLELSDLKSGVTSRRLQEPLTGTKTASDDISCSDESLE